jgi:hypothetical protein
MQFCVEVLESTFTLPFPFHPILYLYLYIEDNVSFKFGGREKHFVAILYMLWMPDHVISENFF